MILLTLLRNHGTMAKADIACVTGLSAQTVSVTIRALEQDGFFEKGDPVRGRIGQPSVPMSLAANGAYFLGLKIGRRSSEMILIDFHGAIRDRISLRHDWPDPSIARQFARRAAHDLVAKLPAPDRARVAGLGIAQMPRDFVYFYIGFFIGGGVVLNGALHTGESGNSGALGSMPVRGPDGASVQLIDLASIFGLERRLVAEGLDPALLWTDPHDWPVPDHLIADWIAMAADAIAQASVACLAVVDFKAVVIDGWFPPAIRQRLLDAVQIALTRQNLAGLDRPTVTQGSLGSDARALGAAALPLTDRFLITADGSLGHSA